MGNSNSNLPGSSFLSSKKIAEMSEKMSEHSEGLASRIGEAIGQDQSRMQPARGGSQYEKDTDYGEMHTPETVSLDGGDVGFGLDGMVSTVADNKINSPEGIPSIFAEEDDKEDENNPLEKLEDGSVLCKHCGTLLEDKSMIEITDGEILSYMVGGKIIKDIPVGRIGTTWQSLDGGEISYINERIAELVEAGVVANSNDYSNKQSLFQMVFSLTRLDGKDMGTPSSKENSAEVVEAFNKKLKRMNNLGQQMLVRLSSKQSLLERSIENKIDTEEKIKN